MSLSSTAPSIGKVAAGTAATTFTVAAVNGNVTIGSGGAQFIPYNATRTALTTITVNCTGGNKCHTNNITITVTAGSGANRLGQITGFTADFTNGATAQFVSGTTSCTCTSMSFVMKPVVASGTSGSATFHLGLSVPVNTTGTLGSATSGYSISASGSGYTTGNGSAAVQSTVEGKLGITKGSDLQYGTVVLIAGQSGTMTWDAATQSLSTSPATGLVVMKGTTSIGAFTVTGTPSQSINFTLSGNAGLPNNLTLVNGQGNSLNITLSTTAQGSQSIPIAGSLPFYLGGTINISPTMHTGAYSGAVTLTVQYQ